jgi:secreted trypsin-like serine protease
MYRFATKLTMTVPLPRGVRLDFYCSGALIAPSWIITAGHCFVDAAGRPVSGPVPYRTIATVGRTDLADRDERGHEIAVTEVRQAPGTDIALGRLARPVTDVTPLRLSTTAPAVGQTLRITGWGATNALGLAPATHLQTGLVTITTVTATVVGVKGLAPSPDTSACNYDSGAPYFAERPDGPQLVSVESDGPPCPHALEETTSRVDTVAPWIVSTIQPRR